MIYESVTSSFPVNFFLIRGGKIIIAVLVLKTNLSSTFL